MLLFKLCSVVVSVVLSRLSGMIMIIENGID